jgi:hypothetical protein
MVLYDLKLYTKYPAYSAQSLVSTGGITVVMVRVVYPLLQCTVSDMHQLQTRRAHFGGVRKEIFVSTLSGRVEGVILVRKWRLVSSILIP